MQGGVEKTAIVIAGPCCLLICLSVSSRRSNSGAGMQTPSSLANAALQTPTCVCASVSGVRPYGMFDVHMIKTKKWWWGGGKKRGKQRD